VANLHDTFAFGFSSKVRVFVVEKQANGAVYSTKKPAGRDTPGPLANDYAGTPQEQQ